MSFQLNDSITITSSNELIIKNTSLPFDLSSKSDGIILPIGTSSERPQVPSFGMMRFNSTLSKPEVYTFEGWTPIDTDYSSLTDITPRSLPHSSDVVTITGKDFVPGMTFEFVGSTGTSRVVPSWSLVSSTTVQATRPSIMPPDEEPYTLRVTMPNGSQYELLDIVEVGDTPIIISPAAGALGTFSSGFNITPISFTAFDSDGSNIVSMTKTSDSSLLNFVYNNSNVALLSGTTTDVLQATTTYNFTVDAMDSGSNVASKNYNITVLYTPLAITSALPANISQNSLSSSYSTSYTFSANKAGAVWSLSPSSAYATINASTGVMSVAFNQGVSAVGSFTVTASWGIDSASQTWSYTVYNYDVSVYPTNPWAILDVATLSTQANNSTVEQWGVQRVFKQSVVANRPTYVSTGGYNNGPYVFFNRTNSTFLDAGSQTITPGAGFTVMLMIKLVDSVGRYEHIFDFGVGVLNSSQHALQVGRDNTGSDFRFLMYGTDGSATVSRLSLAQNVWMFLAVRFNGTSFDWFKDNQLMSTVAAGGRTYSNVTRTVTNIGKAQGYPSDAAYLNAHISKSFIYNRALSDNEMSLIYAKMINAPAITLRPANITTQNTSAALYSIAYTFTGVASAGTIAWTINNTTFGNIDASTGAITLTFPIYTTASGTFIVTATDSNGSSTYSWTYAITNIPLITSSQPAAITQSTGTASYSTSYTFTANQTVTWSLNTSTYGSINSSTGALTLTFPIYTAASSNFIVTATNQAGFTSTQSWSYTITNIPTITSTQPTNISQNTYTSSYETSYTFTANQAVTWSINTTTYGTIDSSGALTLTFPLNTNATGTFIVTATNVNGYSITQVWTFNIISYDLPAYPTGAWVILDVDTLDSQVNNSSVQKWGINRVFKQDTEANRPIYVSSGGYKNRPYVFFKNSIGASLYAGTQTMLANTNGGGFTALCLINFTTTGSPTNNGYIINFKTTNTTSNNSGEVYFTRETSNFKIAAHFRTNVGYGIWSTLSNNSAVVNDEWMVIGVRWIKISGVQKLQVFKNDKFITENTYTGDGYYGDYQFYDRTFTETFIGTNLNAFISKLFIYDRPLSDNEMSLIHAKMIKVPYIVSILPVNINQSTTLAQYTISYTFTCIASVGSIEWSLTPTTYGNIDSSTGALTLTFPVGTTASGTFVVTATDANGFVTQSWPYAITNLPTITSSQPANIVQNTRAALYTVSYTFTANQTVTWSLSPTTYGNINSTNGELTLTFPQNTTASGSYTVTATGPGGTATNTWTYAISSVLIITSSQPATINGGINAATYSYMFTANVATVVWSLIPTTYGNIDSSTGALALTFPEGITSSGTFVVTATDTYDYVTQSWTYNLNAEKRYPPADVNIGWMTNTSTTLSGQLWGNGTYTVRSSSMYNSQQTPGKLFLYSGSTIWMSGGYYNTSTGLYTGGQNTIVDGVGYAGEWVDIELPYAIVPDYLIILGASNLNRHPLSVIVAGSVNGSTWVTIYTNGSSTTNPFANGPSIYVEPKLEFKFLRCIIMTIQPNVWGAVELNGWKIYSNTKGPSSPTITSSYPSKLIANTSSSIYTISYTFNAVARAGSIAWSVTPTTYGNINSVTGALTLTFPQNTTGTGTFSVKATDLNGNTTQSWDYAVSA